MYTVNAIPVTFAANTSSSAPFDLAPYAGAGVIVGATWNTAMLGFSASPTEQGAYVVSVGNSLSAWGVPAQPNMHVPVPQDVVLGTRWVRLVSHTNGTLVAQGALTVTVLRKG